jgi:flavin reductase (DIM6/NTAB) family NADH-FMN oxidoreductase RutF
MQIDPSLHTKEDNYKLLTNLVVPRPIAWISSLSQSGLINLAPFSFFNAVGSDPMYVVVGIGRRDSGEPKDSARNIQTSGEFVVNLVTEDLLAAMNITAAEFPPDESELSAVNLHAAPSIHLKAPRLAEAQVSLECKVPVSAARHQHAIYRRSGDVSCRRSPAGSAIAHQQLRAHRSARFTLNILSHHRSD